MSADGGLDEVYVVRDSSKARIETEDQVYVVREVSKARDEEGG